MEREGKSFLRWVLAFTAGKNTLITEEFFFSRLPAIIYLNSCFNYSFISSVLLILYSSFCNSKPYYGLMVRPKGASCRGINCSKLIQDPAAA